VIDVATQLLRFNWLAAVDPEAQQMDRAVIVGRTDRLRCRKATTRQEHTR